MRAWHRQAMTDTLPHPWLIGRETLGPLERVLLGAVGLAPLWGFWDLVVRPWPMALTLAGLPLLAMGLVALVLAAILLAAALLGPEREVHLDPVTRVIRDSGHASWIGAHGRTYAFDSTGAARGRVGLVQLTPAGDRWRYEPVDDTPPTAAQLAELAGTYASDEVETTYTVRVVDGTLRAQGRFGPEVTLRPMYRDAFTTGGRIVRFVRDGSGRVTGLDMGNSRAWQVRFARDRRGEPVVKDR